MRESDPPSSPSPAEEFPRLRPQRDSSSSISIPSSPNRSREEESKGTNRQRRAKGQVASTLLSFRIALPILPPPPRTSKPYRRLTIFPTPTLFTSLLPTPHLTLTLPISCLTIAASNNKSPPSSSLAYAFASGLAYSAGSMKRRRSSSLLK